MVRGEVGGERTGGQQPWCLTGWGSVRACVCVGLLNESWAVGVGDLTGDGGSDLVKIRAKDGAVLWQKNAGAWQMEPARVLLPAFPGFKAGMTSPPPRLVVMSVDGRSPKTNKATPDVLVLWHKREEGVTGTLLVATVLFNDGDDKTGPLVQRTYSQVRGGGSPPSASSSSSSSVPWLMHASPCCVE